MKKTLKILLLIFLIFLMLLPSNKIYAADGADSIISGGKGFVELGQEGTPEIDKGKIKDVSDTVYNILLTIGVVVAVLVGAVLGIQFMTGSMEDQAKVKESLIPFVVGCIIVFGAFGIWKLAASIVQSL